MAAKSFKVNPANAKPAAAATTNKGFAPQAAAVNMHLIKMVERATTDYYYDVQYIHDLLLSYRCFTTPSNLFELLVKRYVIKRIDEKNMGKRA